MTSLTQSGPTELFITAAMHLDQIYSQSGPPPNENSNYKEWFFEPASPGLRPDSSVMAPKAISCKKKPAASGSGKNRNDDASQTHTDDLIL